MSYAILRVAKLKTFGQIGGSLSHTFRTRDTPNADPARTPLNEHHGPQTPAEIQTAFKEILPDKRRSDAVLGLEYLITFSPEFGQENDGSAYFEKAREWLIEKHGAENVVSTHVHRDETTPHMVAYVAPMKDGRLRSTAFVGGPQMLREMQTDFAQTVGREFGLERGIEGSAAKHQTIGEYYARANDAMELAAKVDVPLEKEKRGLVGKETDEDFAFRVARTVQDKFITGYIKGQELDALKRREREQAEAVGIKQKRIATLADELSPWRKMVEGLSTTDVRTIQANVQRSAREMRRAAQHVVGWLQDFVQTGITLIREQDTYLDHKVISHTAQRNLIEAGARVGDLVEIKGDAGRVLQRAHDRERDRGPDLGR